MICGQGDTALAFVSTTIHAEKCWPTFDLDLWPLLIPYQGTSRSWCIPNLVTVGTVVFELWRLVAVYPRCTGVGVENYSGEWVSVWLVCNDCTVRLGTFSWSVTACCAHMWTLLHYITDSVTLNWSAGRESNIPPPYWSACRWFYELCCWFWYIDYISMWTCYISRCIDVKAVTVA